MQPQSTSPLSSALFRYANDPSPPHVRLICFSAAPGVPPSGILQTVLLSHQACGKYLPAEV